MFPFDKYCNETYVFLLQTWPWIRVSETVHRLLGHTAHVIVINGNRGLKRMAEQGSECLHRIQRMTRERGSRKVSLLQGDTDTFRYSKIRTIHLSSNRVHRTCFTIHIIL